MTKPIRTILIYSLLGLLGLAFSTASNAKSDLEIVTFNPGAKSLFPISSVLVVGPTEVMLVDAQFQRDDAQSVIDLIKATGKKLSTIYISHGDPDFYFGLDLITTEFPDAKVLTTPKTQKYIQASMQPKLKYWGPILKENAPEFLVLPEVIKGDTLFVDGYEIKVVGLNGHDPKHTHLWIPSVKTVLGGVVLYENMHAWIADTQTPESRQKWYRTLDVMQDLQPEVVIPGHYLNASSEDLRAVEFTRQYVKNFEALAAESSSAADLKSKLQQKYPGLEGETELEISTKVIMGEMSWP